MARLSILGIQGLYAPRARRTETLIECCHHFALRTCTVRIHRLLTCAYLVAGVLTRSWSQDRQAPLVRAAYLRCFGAYDPRHTEVDADADVDPVPQGHPHIALVISSNSNYRPELPTLNR